SSSKTQAMAAGLRCSPLVVEKPRWRSDGRRGLRSATTKVEGKAMIELRVSDARHWTFCPRVIWHREMMAVPVKPTGKMQLGLEAEAALAKFERRRSARRYGLDRAERRFDVVLESSRLGVRGVCDLVLDVPPTVEYWPT